MTTSGLESVGLERLKPLIERLVGGPLEVEIHPMTIGPLAGRFERCGAPSSAAILRCPTGEAWIPAPLPDAPPSTTEAPLYRINGRLKVMPFIRLRTRSKGEEDRDEATGTEYLTLACWLEDALKRWRFRFSPRSGSAAEPNQCSSTFLERLEARQTSETISSRDALNLCARMVTNAVLGMNHTDQYIKRQLGLNIHGVDSWLRNVEPDTSFNSLVQRSQVATARLRQTPNHLVPRIVDERNRVDRIDPAAEPGIDPFHTPEAKKTRLTGYLGVGVCIDEDHRTLILPPSRVDKQGAQRPILSPSTAGIPFLEFNDPRRLLLGAKHRTQAIEINGERSVPTRGSEDSKPLCPPGVHLHVGYLAWRGLNHEDAWIVSTTAARKLGASRVKTYYLPIHAHELTPEIKVKAGDRLRRNAPLIERRVAPAYLTTDVAILADCFLKPDAGPVWSVSFPMVKDLRARHGGVVESVECWDLSRPDRCPGTLTVHPEAIRHLREVVVITVRERLDLQVGDKLANSHGHKGIVGAILQDDAMPRWGELPLELLIDPVSVLGRANWGQVHEALVTAGIDRGENGGRSIVEPPVDESQRWIEKPVEAIAGIQFIMRLDKHARDEIRVGHRGRVTREDTFALWGYAQGSGVVSGQPTSAELSAGAATLRRLLRTAGYNISIEGDSLVFEALDLAGKPPRGNPRLDLGEILAEASDARQSAALRRVDRWLCQTPEGSDLVLVLPEQVAVEFRLRHSRNRDVIIQRDVRWLEIPWKIDRPPRSVGREEWDELTLALRKLRHAVSTANASARKKLLPRAVARIMRTSLRIAVGLEEDKKQRGRVLKVGNEASKRSCLVRKVLGQERIGSSVRATIAPLGPDVARLDEIVLPQSVRAHLPESEISGVWLKRDPVLHRWGLLRVRARFDDNAEGEVIRLPASLLGPLNADFDGDTAAILTSIPCIDESQFEWDLPPIAWDEVGERPMFLPGKQYRYGLFLLLTDRNRLDRFVRDLIECKAPIPDCLKTPLCRDDGKQDLDVRLAALIRLWASHSSEAVEKTYWWKLLESHSLSALTSNPGIGLSLSMAEPRSLPVVRCGAAKFREGSAEEAFCGRVLERYRSGRGGTDDGPDPVELMIESGQAKGVFGSAARKLLYSAPQLDVGLIRKIQFVTEQMQQRALNSKSERALSKSDFRRCLRRLLVGDASLTPALASSRRCEGDGRHREELISEFLKSEGNECVLAAWEGIGEAMPSVQERPWAWVLDPARLLARIHISSERRVQVPLNDPRGSSWIQATGIPGVRMTSR